MKRIIMALAFIFIMAGLGEAAGQYIQTSPKAIKTNTMRVVEVGLRADATTGDFKFFTTKTSLSEWFKGWYLYKVVTSPMSVRPTDNYDIKIKSEYGNDVMDTELSNRDTATVEEAVPKIDNTFAAQPIFTPLTIEVENNTQASAGITLYLYFVK